MVVQKMMRADIWVSFTSVPFNGNRNEMAGNFIFGLGEKLVLVRLQLIRSSWGEKRDLAKSCLYYYNSIILKVTVP